MRRRTPLGTAQDVGLQSSLLHLGQSPVRTAQARFTVHFFRDLVLDRTAMAIVCGDPTVEAPLLCRVHSSCLTSECLMGRDCDCVEQLEEALARIAQAGRGIVFYLMQEGRGAGLSAKARDRMIVQASENRVTTFEAYAAMGLPADLRRYESIAAMARLLGVRAPLQLLTNNPEKADAVAAALVGDKLEVCGTEPISSPASVFNSDYLRAKHASGHALEEPARRLGALPPDRVRVFEPVALSADPQRVVMASYFLPIVLPGYSGSSREADWFRLSVIFESATARETILLSKGIFEGPEALEWPRGSAPIVFSLLDRLPIEGRVQGAVLTRELHAIQCSGRGSVEVVCEEGVPELAAAHAGPPSQRRGRSDTDAGE